MAQNHILVCVTEQLHCSELIRQGRALADEEQARLTVLHVRTRQKTLMGNPDVSSALNQLYASARDAEAEMEIISSPEVESTICDYVRHNQVTKLVIGRSPLDGRPSMGMRLAAMLPEIEIVTAESTSGKA